MAADTVIPPLFDPVERAEPESPEGFEPLPEPEPDVLQLPQDTSAFEGIRDPEDETLDLPNEEQAMHVTTRVA